MLRVTTVTKMLQVSQVTEGSTKGSRKMEYEMIRFTTHSIVCVVIGAMLGAFGGALFVVVEAERKSQ